MSPSFIFTGYKTPTQHRILQTYIMQERTGWGNVVYGGVNVQDAIFAYTGTPDSNEAHPVTFDDLETLLRDLLRAQQAITLSVAYNTSPPWGLEEVIEAVQLSYDALRLGNKALDPEHALSENFPKEDNDLTLDSIKSSSNAQERLAAAQNDHQSALKNQCSVHNRVDQQKKQNDSHHTQHLTQTHAQKSTLQSDIALLSDQKLKLQDSQTQLKRKLQQQNITVNQVNQAPGLTNPSAGQANQVPGQIAPTSGQINQTQQPSTRANLSAPADSRMPRTIPAQNNQIQQATSSGNRPLNADALKRVLQNPQTRAQFTQNFTKNHGGDPRFNAFIAALKQMPANKPAPENKINSALKQLQTSESLTAQKEKQQDKQKTPTPTSTTPKMR